MKKICIKCLLEKEICDFGNASETKDGLKARCKKCLNENYNKLYKSKLKHEKIIKSNKYYSENKEEILKKRNEYYIKNKSDIIKRQTVYIRKKRAESPYLKSMMSFRGLVRKLISNKEWKTFNYLGYTFDDLITHLGSIPNEKQHIDHLIPISWFLPECELNLIFSLDNLQLLSVFENLSKGNSYSHEISYKYYLKIKDKIKPKYLTKLKWKT